MAKKKSVVEEPELADTTDPATVADVQKQAPATSPAPETPPAAPQAQDEAVSKVRATERAIAEAQIEAEAKLEAKRQAKSEGGKPQTKVGESQGATASPAPTSPTLENSETTQVEKMAAELASMRKRMAERECQEIDEAKVLAPPSRKVADPVRLAGINLAMEVLLSHYPLPKEIVFDPKDVDAPVLLLKTFGEAAEECSEYSYAFGGLAALYHWRRGQCFVAIEHILAPQGLWGEWYRHHGFEKSEVSRDRRLFLACPDGDKTLIGYSEAAAHRKFVAKKKPKTKPIPQKSPAEKEEEDRSRWLPFVPKEGTSQEAPSDTTKNGEIQAIPQPGEIVKEIEKTWVTDLSVPYLLQAGINFWQIAFERSGATDQEAIMQAVEKMAVLIGHLKNV